MQSPAGGRPSPFCRACGVVAPARCDGCESCGGALASTRAFTAPSDVYWAAVRASFTCRSCGFPSPLDGVVLSGGAECAQCGSYQQLDRDVWGKALAFAHAVADLGGPHPEGRLPSADVWIGDANPHAKIGMTETFARSSEGEFRLEASPGQPVCRRCHVPREVRFEPGGVSTVCTSCGASARYAMPAELQRIAPGARGVVADEQRADRPDVRVAQGDAGLVTLSCPNCGAAVRPSNAQTVECGYCHTLAFVPARARARGPGQLASPVVFWLAFQGPSSARAELEQAKPPPEKKTTTFFARGLSPLPGIELAAARPGLDAKQLALTAGLTLGALAVGYAVALAVGWT